MVFVLEATIIVEERAGVCWFLSRQDIPSLTECAIMACRNSVSDVWLGGQDA